MTQPVGLTEEFGGAFHSRVWKFGNFTCLMKRYIQVAQTRTKPPRAWLLLLGTTICQMERDIFVRSKWTTFKAGHEYSGKTNRNFCNFVLNGEFLGILMTLTDCRRSIKENILPFVIFHPMKALGELMLPLKSLSPNKFTQKLHFDQWLFHRHYNNVVTIIIITVSIILL